MDLKSIRTLLDGSRRHVAFIDVLGYKSIVTGTLPDERKFRRLHALFETFGVAVFTGIADFNQNLSATDPGYVHGVTFSDSLYLAAQDLPALLRFLEGMFATTYGFQEHTYDEDADSWVPFIRAGIAHGWVVNFRDVTMNQLQGRGVFRNPVGPAVADAYVLTECTGKLPGMRCFMERRLLEGVDVKQVAAPKHYLIETASRILRLLDVPPGDSKTENLELVELAWPCHVIDGDNCCFHKPLAAVRRQFEGGDAVKHYNGTVELFERTVEIVKDEVAKRVWDEQAGRTCLLLPGPPGK